MARPTSIIGAGSGRLGQSSTNETVVARFDAGPMLYLVDRYTQNFRNGAFYRALKQANEIAAHKVQEGMRDRVRSQIGPRPQRPGARLEHAIMHHKNAQVFANTFSVGIENWMDQSPAKLYWRSIEHGLPGYDARVLFTNNGGEGGFGSAGPMAGKPRWARPGEGGPHMRMPRFSTRGVLVHVDPIEAFNYSEGGLDAYAEIDMADLYEQQLGMIGIAITKDNKGDFFKPPR